MPEIVLHYLPPSPNQTRGMHWGKVAQLRKKAQGEVWFAWCCAGKPKAAGRKAIVDITIEAHGLRDDLDNRMARFKRELDSLVQVGALEDDSPQWLELRIPTRTKGVKGKPRITIHIEYEENPQLVESSGAEHQLRSGK